MGLPELLKDLWLKTLGGTNPALAASASGDIGQMVKYLVATPARVWTPFGIGCPYYGGGVDTVISSNTTIDAQFKQYRDLTINSGIVLTAGFSPQIIICNNLIFGNTASQISANGLGAAGNYAGNDGANGLPSGVANSLEAFFVSLGGVGGAGVGPAGSPASVALKGACLTHQFPFGVGGGGGGGGQRGTGNGGSGGAGIAGGGAGGASSGGGGANGNGGNGGGVLIVICQDVKTAAGIISANGAAGLAGTGTNAGGGGGGGGGLLLCYTLAATVTPTLQSIGGTGGAGIGAGSAGGAGGAGIAQLVRSV